MMANSGKPSKPSGIRAIYIITQLLFWFYSIASVIAIVLIVSMAIGYKPPFDIKVSLPMKFNVEEVGTLNSEGSQSAVSVLEATGKMQFETVPVSIRRYFAITMGSMLLLVFVPVLYFKKFIAAINQGHFFDLQNIIYLRRLAYALVAIWVYGLGLSYWLNQVLQGSLVFETLTFTSNYDIGVGLPIFALFIWVLSHIFAEGATMREEQEYTI